MSQQSFIMYLLYYMVVLGDVSTVFYHVSVTLYGSVGWCLNSLLSYIYYMIC